MSSLRELICYTRIMQPQALPQKPAMQIMGTTPLLVSTILFTLSILPTTIVTVALKAGLVFDGLFIALPYLVGFSAITGILQIIIACKSCWRFMHISRVGKVVVISHSLIAANIIFVPIAYIVIPFIGLLAASGATPDTSPSLIGVLLSFVFAILYGLLSISPFILIAIALTAIISSFMIINTPPALPVSTSLSQP